MADWKRFPNPDPVLRHIDPESTPSGWLALRPYEKSLRGRYAIIAICAGLDPILAWFYALDGSEASTKEIEEVILPLTDGEVEEMVRSAAADRRVKTILH